MTTALLLIDVQRNMLEGTTPVPVADAVRPALASLLTRARDAGALVVHVQNDGPTGEPDEPHTPGWELVFPTAQGEPVIRKSEQNGFAGTELAATLRSAKVDRIVVAGMQSDFCVAATSRGALREGLEVRLAAGAHATYDGRDSAATISATVEKELAEEGVKVLPAGAIDFG